MNISLKDKELRKAALKRQLEDGRADVEAGRVKPFDPKAIKQAGRAKLAKK